jgi:hypothetical protein
MNAENASISNTKVDPTSATGFSATAWRQLTAGRHTIRVYGTEKYRANIDRTAQ